MTATPRWRAAALAAVLWFLAVGPAAAADAAIEAFFGRYEGASISSERDGLTKRDLGVVIESDDEGFRVEWTTTTRKSDGSRKRKSYSIKFESTPRDGVYASAMRRNKFGARVPLDPMKGDPYVWARIVDRTLTVYALLIVDDGSYEIQVYDRTLTADGLRLEFRRFAEGEMTRAVTGDLARTDR